MKKYKQNSKHFSKDNHVNSNSKRDETVNKSIDKRSHRSLSEEGRKGGLNSQGNKQNNESD